MPPRDALLAVMVAYAHASCALHVRPPARDAAVDTPRDVADARALDGAAPGDDGVDRDTPARPLLAIGTGYQVYEELPPAGGVLEMEYGPQGGYHVWGRARFAGAPPADVDVSFTITRLADGAVLHAPEPQRRWLGDGPPGGLTHDAASGELTTGPQLLVLAIRCFSEATGARARFEVLVHDRRAGTDRRDAREVTLVDAVRSPPCRDAGR